MTKPATEPQHRLWAITSYFNPMRYQRKLANFRIFRKHLRTPLVAVELAHGFDFELQPCDAEILIQLRGGSVMWQKERLLNIALHALPSDCDKVAWLDCDVVFDASDWVEIVSSLLDHFMLVQPFSHLYRTSREWRPGNGAPATSELRTSSPFLIASGMPIATCLGSWSEEIKSAPGRAWAARRELLEENQLYDACVIGGADSAMLRAAYGCFDEAVRFQHMNSWRKKHFFACASKFHNAVSGKVSFAPGSLFHLWHGTLENRRYRERFQEFTGFEFNPFADIMVYRTGLWCWNSKKPEMHDYVQRYFATRKEDG
jgi:hypothetical protein